MQQSKTNRAKQKNPQKSNVRIIGGSMRGRKISFTSGEGLRPTLDRVRETLFNWLAADIHGANCLDLYAGSGAIGFEAISRGANSMVMVDASSQVTDNLKKNLNTLSVDNIKVVNQKAAQFLAVNRQQFDLVFLDPPFGKDLLQDSLTQLIPHLAKHALIYVEQENTNNRLQFGSEWKVLKSKQTSRFCYELLCLQR